MSRGSEVTRGLAFPSISGNPHFSMKYTFDRGFEMRRAKLNMASFLVSKLLKFFVYWASWTP